MINRNHYAGAHAVIIVYSVDSLNSFKSVESYYQSAKDLVREDAIFVLAGNKCDLHSQRMVLYDDLMEKASDLDEVKFYETSAKPECRETIE